MPTNIQLNISTTWRPRLYIAAAVDFENRPCASCVLSSEMVFGSGGGGTNERRWGREEAEVLALKPESRILGQCSNLVSGSRMSQASSPWAKQQSLTCSIMEKPHTGLDECPRILLSCFRAWNSGRKEGRKEGRSTKFHTWHTTPVSQGDKVALLFQPK